MIFENFNLKRSFEMVTDMQCSSNPMHSYLTVIIKNKLHVYNYLTRKFLFSYNISNNLPNSKAPYQRMLLADNDQLLIFRESKSSIMLLSINHHIEMY